VLEARERWRIKLETEADHPVCAVTGKKRLVGSAKYADAHKDEWRKSPPCWFTIRHGRVLELLGLHDNYQDRELWTTCLRR